jgi:hypothetical protein
MQEPSHEGGTTVGGRYGELCGAGHTEPRAGTLEGLASEDQRVAIRPAGADLVRQRERREGKEGQ